MTDLENVGTVPVWKLDVRACRGLSMNVLLIGKDPTMLETLQAGLRERGIVAEGTTDMAGAGERFDARNFDLISLGGGVGPVLREQLKRAFEARNPQVIVLDVFAPVAVEQIDQALRGERDRAELASRFEVSEDSTAYRVHLEMTQPSLARVQVYHLGETLDVTTQIERHVDIGPATFHIDASEVRRGVNMLLVTLDEQEFHTHRFERS